VKVLDGVEKKVASRIAPDGIVKLAESRLGRSRVVVSGINKDTAVQVFAGNLRDLLLAAPAGARPTMGLDPGYRTGVKVAVVSGTGQVATTTTIYPHEPQRRDRDQFHPMLSGKPRQLSNRLVPTIGGGQGIALAFEIVS
jgi:hypothetical protein